jgi:hypothetical protein
VIAFAPEEEQVYDSFAAAIGFPMAVILPMIAILSSPGNGVSARGSPPSRSLRTVAG